MIEPFEAALADLIADRVAAANAVASVGRPRDGMGAPDPGAARVLVQVLDAALTDEVGGDRDERLGDRGDYRVRAPVRAGGQVLVSVEVGPATLPADQQAQRAVVLEAADAVLVALHEPGVRTGAVFGDAHDQGFAVDAFRLARIDHPGDPAGHRRIDVWCEYRGRFWPVVPEVAGDVIAAPVHSRLVLGDLELPAGLQVTAGDPDLVVPIRLDLRARGGAAAAVAARLAGAAPPGELVGDPAGPPGWTGYPADATGTVRVVYRPPAALAAAASARVRLALAGEDRATVALGEFAIEVLAA